MVEMVMKPPAKARRVVHMSGRLGLGVYYSKCHRATYNKLIVTRWAKTTCLRCLSKKEKGE